MPEQSTTAEILSSIREHLEELQRPGSAPVPVHPEAVATLEAVLDYLTEVEVFYYGDGTDGGIIEIREIVRQDHVTLTTLRERFETLVLQLGDLPGTPTLAEIIATLRQRLDALENAAFVTQEQLDQTLETRLADLREALTTLGARMTATENALETLQTEFHDWAQQLPLEVRRLVAAELEAVQNVIQTLRETDGRHEGRIAALESVIAELRDKIGVSRPEVEEMLQQALTSMRDAIVALQRDNASDAARLVELERWRETLADLVTAAQVGQMIAAALAGLDTEFQPLRDRLTRAETSLQTLDARVAEIAGQIPTPERIDQLIAAALTPVRDQLESLREQNRIDDERINDLIVRVTGLENSPPGGVSIEQVDARIDEKLGPVNSAIDGLRQTDTETQRQLDELRGLLPAGDILTRRQILDLISAELVTLQARLDALGLKNEDQDEAIRRLVADVEALRQQPTGTGVSEARVLELIARELMAVNDRIAALETQDTTIDGRLNVLGVRVSDLEGKLLNPPSSWLDVITQRTETVKLYLLDKIRMEKEELIRLIEQRIADLRIPTETQINNAIAAQVGVLERSIHELLELRATKTELLALKGNLESQLSALPTDQDLAALEARLQTELRGKIGPAELNTALALKADLAAVTTMIADGLATKVGPAELLALQTALEQSIGTRADQSALEQLRDSLTDALALTASLEQLHETEAALRADLATQPALEALETMLTDGLATKAGTGELTSLRAELLTKIELTATRAQLEALIARVDELAAQFVENEQNNPASRLARLCLLGHGIVGGLELYSDERDYIFVSPGIGITPRGRLIVEPAKRQFSHCQPFDAADIDFFRKPQPQGGVYPVWELLEPSAELPDAARGLTQRNASEHNAPFISDKVVLLWPDGAGHRYLLVGREDLLVILGLAARCQPWDQRNTDYLFGEGYSPEDDWLTDDDLTRCLHPAYRLPEIPLFRFGFFTDRECRLEELDTTEFPALTTADDFYQTWKPIVGEAVGHLEKAIGLLIKWYRPTLFPLLEQAWFEEQLALLAEKWTKFKVQNDPGRTAPADLGTKYYAQYFYDWTRNLIAGYHELRGLLIELMAEVRALSPETLDAEYDHLVLGPAQQFGSTGLDPVLRSGFRQPPVFNGNAARLEACRLYFRRVFELIEAFYLPDYARAANMPRWCHPLEGSDDVIDPMPPFDRVRITPGKSFIFPLSEQSLPFYYPLNNSAESLQHFWNYRRARTLTTDRCLSYHANDPEYFSNTYTLRRDSIRPLYYTLDAFDFYHVEGFIGKETVTFDADPNPATARYYGVIEALRFLIQKHNLDFELFPIDLAPDLSEEYQIGSDAAGDQQLARAFRNTILGAEHRGGVPKGGTLIVVLENGRAIADFSVPYRISPSL